MMDLTLENCLQYIDFLKNSLDQKWLETKFSDIANYYNTPKNAVVLGDPEKVLHPLTFLLFRGGKNLAEHSRNNRIKLSNEMIKATMLGLFIKILRTANVEGLDDKLKELMSDNYEQHEKTVFELDMASAFTQTGHKVKFVKTESIAQKRTFDIIVDDKIEVECKKKDKFTKRDIHNNDLWNRLNRKLRKLMIDSKRYYFVYVLFKTEPSSDSITKILKIVRKSVLNNRNEKLQNDEFDITVQKICNHEENFPLNSTAKTSGEIFNIDPYTEIAKIVESRIEDKDLLDYNKILPDFDVLEPRITRTNDGRLIAGEIMKFIFKTHDIPDRFKGVLTSIKDAKNQLSGVRCGIICVNITNISDKLVEKDLHHLGYLFEDELKNNSSISAVAISSERFHVEDNGVRLRHIASVIRNKNAKIPLADNFVIFNQ